MPGSVAFNPRAGARGEERGTTEPAWVRWLLTAGGIIAIHVGTVE